MSLWRVCSAESPTELNGLFQMWMSVSAEPHAPRASASTLKALTPVQSVRVGTG